MASVRARVFLSFLLFVCGSGLAAPAAAEDCQLKQLADVTLTVSKQGNVLVPVQVEGMQLKFALSMDSLASSIVPGIANQLSVPRAMTPRNISIEFGGIRAAENITPQVTIGSATGPAVLVVIPQTFNMDPEADGYLAFDILKNFDVEVNLSKNEMKLFSPAHCPGKVIYWTQSAAVAVMPIVVRNRFGFIFPMELDGQLVEAAPIFSTDIAKLSSLVADQVYGVKGQTSHVFDSLAADGLAISHPHLDIYEDDTNGECRGNIRQNGMKLFNETDRRLGMCFGPPELMLGRSEMAALRMYFAFSERKIYATAANAQ